MDRRQFGKLTGVSALAMAAGVEQSEAQSDASNVTFGGSFPPLGPGLTAFGSEAAGNAAGTIPPYTGGMATVPAGFTWDSTKTLPPDFFASDAMLYEVNQSNVSQYAHLLSDGIQALIAKGFSCPVYPSHRTVCYPDFVLKAMANNVGKATLIDKGRGGFSGVLGLHPVPADQHQRRCVDGRRPADLEPSDPLAGYLAELLVVGFCGPGRQCAGAVHPWL